MREDEHAAGAGDPLSEVRVATAGGKSLGVYAAQGRLRGRVAYLLDRRLLSGLRPLLGHDAMPGVQGDIMAPGLVSLSTGRQGGRQRSCTRDGEGMSKFAHTSLKRAGHSQRRMGVA